MNATFNPDFGQVEVDPAVVNLGVYETFFQEKRPFFVEGSEIFAFGRGRNERRAAVLQSPHWPRAEPGAADAAR